MLLAVLVPLPREYPKSSLALPRPVPRLRPVAVARQEARFPLAAERDKSPSIVQPALVAVAQQLKSALTVELQLAEPTPSMPVAAIPAAPSIPQVRAAPLIPRAKVQAKVQAKVVMSLPTKTISAVTSPSTLKIPSTSASEDRNTQFTSLSER